MGMMFARRRIEEGRKRAARAIALAEDNPPPEAAPEEVQAAPEPEKTTPKPSKGSKKNGAVLDGAK